MDTETVPTKRRWRVVVAVSIVVSLLCVGWWGVRLQWFVAEPDRSEHVVEFPAQTVSLSDGAQARVSVAALVVGRDSIEPVAGAATLLADAVIERLVDFEATALRSPDGQDRLRGHLVGDLRLLVPDAVIERVLLTELLVQ